jgi:alpha-mannosidase
MLLCQFHDVLPGSAIGMVYDDAEKVQSTLSASVLFGLGLSETPLDRFTPMCKRRAPPCSTLL